MTETEIKELIQLMDSIMTTENARSLAEFSFRNDATPLNKVGNAHPTILN